MVSAAKDPKRVASGKAGMRARWGAPRKVRLDDLTPEQRDVIVALVAAQAAANKAAAERDDPAA